jgi:hypothetical protein
MRMKRAELKPGEMVDFILGFPKILEPGQGLLY